MADALYCAIAALGFGHVIGFLEHERVMIRMVGGLILILVGLKIFTMPVKERSGEFKKGIFNAFFSTFLLTLSSPIPIIVFASAFAATDILSWDGNKIYLTMIVLGVFSGSAIWSPILGLVTTFFTSGLALERLRLLNKIAGAAIFAIGLIGVWMALRHFSWL